MHNLRARLGRIRQHHDLFDRGASSDRAALPVSLPSRNAPLSGDTADSAIPPGWVPAGYQVLRRTLTIPLAIPAALPPALAIILPDVNAAALPLTTDRFLFFDLETTGLSGGAGTVAFLAAFGRLSASGPGQMEISGDAAGGTLEVTQLLLLDYSGEADFLEAALEILNAACGGGAGGGGACGGDVRGSDASFLTTYNGKAFDSQILKTRCLMNGLPVPLLPQADLLYPARRLWKRILPNCSQATIETAVLGLDRTGDIPGSLAPNIWFGFLRSGGAYSGEAWRSLLGICDHNVKDIFGLASLFCAFAGIAARPLDAPRRFHCDAENLALAWRRFISRRRRTEPGPLFSIPDGAEETARRLLEAAAREYPQSLVRLALDRMKQGRHEEARAALSRFSSSGEENWKVPCSAALRAIALRVLVLLVVCLKAMYYTFI